MMEAYGSAGSPAYAAVAPSPDASPAEIRAPRPWRLAAGVTAAAVGLAGASLLLAGGSTTPAVARLRNGALDGQVQEDGFGYNQFAPPFNNEREACGAIDNGVDYSLDVVKQIFNVGSASMCCAACEAFEECGSWTWGAAPHTDWLTQVCWLKKAPPPGQQVVKLPKPAVISGFPVKSVHKAGGAPPPASMSDEFDGVVPKLENNAPTSGKCGGELVIEGHGNVQLIRAGSDTPGKPAAPIEALEGDLLYAHMGGRAYFADTCQEGPYSNQPYAALNLLGKTFSWTTDVSGTGCGCNAAFYLVSMKQNSKIGSCGDFYCDAMHVCGVECAEIDMQEANQYSWMSTLHTYNPQAGADSLGVARGYGGSVGEPERRDWTAEEYGPGAKCIDTTKPFQVSVSFPTTADGTLEAMELKLSQVGSQCDLNARNDFYDLQNHQPMQELTAALQAGMTPVISYWKSGDMLWMDGLGADGRGPCAQDTPDWCPDHVRFYEFSLRDIGAAAPAAAAPAYADNTYAAGSYANGDAYATSGYAAAGAAAVGAGDASWSSGA